jgi:hypothetical protein
MESDPSPEFLELIEELDRLAEEQRVVDTRDPNALAACERKLEELRSRIERLRPKGHTLQASSSFMSSASRRR